MRRPLSPVAKPSRRLSQSVANQTYSTQAAAAITAVCAGCPPIIHRGRQEDAGHSQQQQPKQEIGEQHAGSGSGCALPEQAYATYQGDDGAEIGQCVRTMGYRLPYRDVIAFDQAQDSEADHGRRKEPHDPRLRCASSYSPVAFQFIGVQASLVCQMPVLYRGNGAI